MLYQKAIKSPICCSIVRDLLTFRLGKKKKIARCNEVFKRKEYIR